MIKNIIIMAVYIFLTVLLNAQEKLVQNHEGLNYFTNPIFKGDYPDPSILRVKDDFYMVHSSFLYYPGLQIWHSTNLINWKPVTKALNTYLGSVWAPDLVKYGDMFYIYFPANNTNYVITAKNIEGPWSEPIEIPINLIDPGHITDTHGNRYLYFSNGNYVPLTKDGLSITGKIKPSYTGWNIPINWRTECFCMEGPKLFKRGDYYYLTVAEGGTAGPATGHMVISARSKSPFGPWENAPFNPIIRTRSKAEKWWSVGHGTVFNDASDNWYMVFHGYENGFYNMGRQTLLVPIEWTEDGWYKLPDKIVIDKEIDIPSLQNKYDMVFNLNDDFSAKTLGPQWRFFGGFNKDSYTLVENSLVLQGNGSKIENTIPLLVMPKDHSFSAEVEIEIVDNAIGGLIMFYNSNAFSGILADQSNVLGNLRGWQFISDANKINRHVYLKLKSINNSVDLYFSLDGELWQKTANSFETDSYNHNALGGFLSVRIGLVSLGEGQIKFKNFKYNSIDNEE